MSLRRRMLEHLGIDLTADEAPAYRDELRETLLGCGGCTRCSLCEGWLEQHKPGAPQFCSAHEAYDVLSEACRNRRRVA